MEQVAALYKTEYAERNLKKSAMRGINTAINVWIVPLIGNRKIAKLTRVDVQQWINSMSDGTQGKKGISPKTIRNYYSVLRGIMDFAIDMGIISDTPCKNIRLPKKEHKEATYYGHSEMERLLEALSALSGDELKFKVAIYLALFGGLRKSEILGLNWEDVNYETGEIKICRTRQIAPKVGVYEDTPKTEKSARSIVLPKEVVFLLKSLKVQQSEAKLMLANKYEDSPAVLRGDFGKPLYPQVLQRWFTSFLKENNLPHIGLHGLRHTHASMLAHMGADKMQVSTRLGHSQLSTTLNIYTHLFEEADRTIADNLSQQFFSKKQG
ncbi:tyrosine-type recombinase/integrase [Zhenpiania hominis]|uniref:tyrosine-type recombinase/integrase n=1 Tax=Zhenpiania hominis TaxID=2763644 RepID=UPI0039F51424